MSAPEKDAGPEHMLVRLSAITLSLGGQPIFSDLNAVIHAKGHTALLGRNGTGKSTLLRLIQGDLRLPQSMPRDKGPAYGAGSITWNFTGMSDVSALAPKKYARLVSPGQQRNYVRQGWRLSGEDILLSGLDNAPMVYGELPADRYSQAAELAEQAGAGHLLSMEASAMSQGQLRLALILRALMARPALLLLDEPFDGLDEKARAYVHNAVSVAARQGATLVVSAHRRADVPPCITQALLLKDGKAHSLGLDSVAAPAHVPYGGAHAEELLVSEEATSTPGGTAPANGATIPPASTLHRLLATPARPSRDSFACTSERIPLLRLHNVDVFINRVKVLHGIHWQVNYGQHWLVGGANGSGKSTLLRLLYGEEFAAFGGTVSWCGRPRPPLEELRTWVGYVSDSLQHAYDYDLTALEVVASGLRGSIGLYGDPLKEDERERAFFWLERMGAAALSGRSFHSLSSGQARRVLLARALAPRPRVFLLDEPCSGLDAEGRGLFLKALPLLADAGSTLIHVTHQASDKSDLFTHELTLAGGRVSFAGKRKE